VHYNLVDLVQGQSLIWFDIGIAINHILLTTKLLVMLLKKEEWSQGYLVGMTRHYSGSFADAK
jgi:hypothetical protein